MKKVAGLGLDLESQTLTNKVCRCHERDILNAQRGHRLPQDETDWFECVKQKIARGSSPDQPRETWKERQRVGREPQGSEKRI